MAKRRSLRQLDDFLESNEEEWIEPNQSIAEARRLRGEYVQKLEEGYERAGVWLSHHECWDLIQLVLDGERRPGKPPPLRKKAEAKARFVAAYSRLLEVDGFSTEAAITQTRKVFGVSRSYVFDARRRESDTERQSNVARWESDPSERQRQRRRFELFAPLF